MAYNNKKILQVLIGEIGKVPERRDGYKEDLTHLLIEVLQLEREHAISRTTVVKNIADQVNTVGMSLYRSRTGSRIDQGGS